jgi:hypothetical protein
MRKNLAGVAGGFPIETGSWRARGTCPQFLWINLCGIGFPKGKSLILCREILPMKNLAA